MAISTYQKVLNLELLEKTDKNLLLIQVKGLKRTACLCGHVVAGIQYVCPVCGNSEYLKIDYYGNTLKEFEGDVEITANSIRYYTPRLKFKKGTEMELIIEEYTRVNFTLVPLAHNITHYDSFTFDKVFVKLLENKDKLSSHFAETVEIMESLGTTSGLAFVNLMAHRNGKLVQFIKNEQENHPALCREIVKYQKLGIHQDLPYSNFKELKRFYKVRDEFDWILDDFAPQFFGLLKSTNTMRHSTPAINELTFEVSNRWDTVPEEIKNILKYYVEHRIISPRDYLNVVLVAEEVLRNTEAFSMFLKRSLMQLKGEYISRVNECHTFLCIQGLDVTPENLNLKKINQLKNVSILKEVSGKEISSIDLFLNNLDADAVNAISELASTKGVRKKK